MVDSKHSHIKINSKTYFIKTFHKPQLLSNMYGLSANIFASGPSIVHLDFSNALLDNPSIFVNGSLTLTSEYQFKNIVAYVISDERFVKHNAKILEQHYKGQPLYLTEPVLTAMAKTLPDLIDRYHESMTIIYPVDRPLSMTNTLKILTTIPLIRKLVQKKIEISTLSEHLDFIIDTSNDSQSIGVSLDIEKGFVEAGTVAFVAAQLAFTLGAHDIHLYGIDLINHAQPRFYEQEGDTAPIKLDKAISNRIVPSFELLGRVYKERGVMVKNHSPISQNLFKHL